MLDLKRIIKKIAPADINVLICGETGTGKELVAHELHRRSLTRTGPFVAINCAAIPDNLLESELFGHERGAFTGALNRKLGKIETANGGTLFLDEIGDMPSNLQAKLLRFTEDRFIERVGANDRIPVDVRLVAATHQNISKQIVSGTFRQDLYYRLAEITLTLPPLRKRGQDTLLIAQHLLQGYAEGDTPPTLSEDALEAISRWHWPGNVRELENILKRACLLRTSNRINSADLELFDVAQRHDRLPLAAPPKAIPDVERSGNSTLDLQEVRRQAEQSAIIRAIARADDNVSKAAKLLGVTRPTLYNLMDKYNIRNRPLRQPTDQDAQSNT